MNISLKQLEIFTSVVVAGSITKASRRVQLSQPSISQQLAKLEEKLGTQLILRNRTGRIELTAAGEFWFKSATDLIRRYEAMIEDHRVRFSEGSVTIKMGTTPTLRGRFAGAVARIVLQEDRFARFEQVWSLNSTELVEQLRVHQLNCALVNSISIEEDRGSFSVTPVFRDQIAWVVPKEIPLRTIKEAMRGNKEVFAQYPALGRYVNISNDAPLQPASDDWYRSHLPEASPVFGALTYPGAVDFVAEGVATTHCPISLLPNLPAQMARKLRWFSISSLSRDIVLVMPKHLLTLPAYARIYAKMQHFAQTEYAQEMTPPDTVPVESLI